ncbi:MAG: mechanosensitive ion channel family protein [Bacteroidia bacterium]|jgi:small conductance mechanosensitive channel|nr:mechanosensitive ion channel family protein [Bacteroidia bacterium]MDG2042511.1 mechanosensitive ion channel family protein [Bacteroidia bacterium]|tara:strand:+ start:4895 stop:5722 length:828 start_codon:yes stop_codon:yes gene_type:complete
MNKEQIQESFEVFASMATNYLPKLAIGLFLLVGGWWFIGRFTKWLERKLKATSIEVTLVPFLCSVTRFSLRVLLLISVASILGIATTSFVAMLGAGSLAIGLALQGSLSHFAGGVVILFFKPFKVGDVIEIDGIKGTVQSITILYTMISTPDDNTAVLPNGQVANNKVLNYTKENNRRIDLSVGIAYDQDIDKAKKVISDALNAVPIILDKPEPFIGVLGFGDSSVNIAFRPYAKSVDYMEAYFAANEAVKKALDSHQIEMPFPQRDIHIKSGKI